MNRLNEQQTANRMAGQPKIEVKKLKSMDGFDGPAYSCELWVNDNMAAHVVQDGHGGCTDFIWVDRSLETQVKAFVDALPNRPTAADAPDWERKAFPDGIKPDLDNYVAGLCDEYENDKRLRRLCKNHIVFTLKTDKPDIIRTIKTPYTREYAKELRAKHGDNLAEIINEKPEYANVNHN